MSQDPPELILMRHAEDRAAAEERFGDTGLSERGEVQARRRGRELASLQLDACWMSPLRRAQQTADLVLAGRSVERITQSVLAEGSLGELAGLGFAEARERHPDDFRLGRSVVARLAAAGRTAPGGESRDAFLERARRGAELLGAHLATGRGRILVVSHGGLLNYALQVLTGTPMRDTVPFGFDHAGWVRVLGYAEAPCFGPFAMLRF